MEVPLYGKINFSNIDVKGGWERTLHELFFPELSAAPHLLSTAQHLLSAALHLLSAVPHLLSAAPHLFSAAPHFRNRGYQSRWMTGVAGD
jgi:hypothetical protein